MVTTAAGHNVTLPCDGQVYPAWSGSSPNGFIQYNNEGQSGFINRQLGSKASRLSWGTNYADLIIFNVLKVEDEGTYECFGKGISNLIELNVKGISRRLIVIYSKRTV